MRSQSIYIYGITVYMLRLILNNNIYLCFERLLRKIIVRIIAAQKSTIKAAIPMPSPIVFFPENENCMIKKHLIVLIEKHIFDNLKVLCAL